MGAEYSRGYEQGTQHAEKLNALGEVTHAHNVLSMFAGPKRTNYQAGFIQALSDFVARESRKTRLEEL